MADTGWPNVIGKIFGTGKGKVKEQQVGMMSWLRGGAEWTRAPLPRPWGRGRAGGVGARSPPPPPPPGALALGGGAGRGGGGGPPWQSSRPGSARWRPFPRPGGGHCPCRSLPPSRPLSPPPPPPLPPQPPPLSALGSEEPPAPPPRRRRRSALGRHSAPETFQRPRLSGTRGGGAGAARGRREAAPGRRALLGRGTARARRRPAAGRLGARRRRHKLRCRRRGRSWRPVGSLSDRMLGSSLVPRSTHEVTVKCNQTR
ncbi:translation initiation factor IF-2-like [Panthera pardus]|uniref:Translation initiation factor IF-2-like n=1 Tax=Panthera pardus TaxID=9691 RepID=A0A9W2UMI6_PANPR|nr:translation initiation factor IF-2-like [Panthera pardus]